MARPPKHCNLTIKGPIQRWDEAIPLGNGRLGCLLWGPSSRLRLSVDRDDLWDTTPAPGTTGKGFTYQNLVRLAMRGAEEEISRVFDAPYDHPTPTKLPAGKLILAGPSLGDYTSTLDLWRAEARLKFAQGCVRSFLHAGRPVGLVALPHQLGVWAPELCMPQFQGDGGKPVTTMDSVETGDLSVLCYPACQPFRDGEVTGAVQPLPSGNGYGFLYLTHRSREEVLLCYTVCRGSPEALAKAAELLRQTAKQGYAAAFAEHRAWWRGFWNRSGVRLPDRNLERVWYRASYYLASASREGTLPAPLQGVWTADDGKLPPWKGDYHNDLNTQLTYAHYLTANQLEQGRCFLDYLSRLGESARAFTQQFYGSPGAVLPGVMAVDGAPLGGWPMYSLAPTNHIWLCQMFHRHWQMTGEERFLREQVIPLFRHCARLHEALLVEGENGFLTLPVSSSPEIGDNRAEAWLPSVSSYDLALLHYLFATIAQLEDGCSGAQGERWRNILRRLEPLAVGDGPLAVCRGMPLRESHRHFSHTVAIWPLQLLDPTDPDHRVCIQATVDQLVELGTGQWVGFSFVWMALLQALLANGEAAVHYLGLFANNFLSVNGFHLNGDYRNRGICRFHYRPFTLEANLFAAEALHHMLLQNTGNRIRLFPALPADWRGRRVGFYRLRTYGGLLLSASCRNGRAWCRASATRSGDWCLEKLAVHTTASRQLWRDSQGCWSLKLEAGDSVIFCGKLTDAPMEE